MAKQVETEIHVPELKRGVVRLRIIGQTPMFQNRMAAKAKQQLLVGGRKKTAADRAQIKHHPIAEFRDSLERYPMADLYRKTALGLRVVAMKAAMCTAALETAGITKTSAQRLLFMPGELANLYGTPQLRMDIVRSADINRTPDVRTRAFLPRWGAEIEVHHVLPQLPVSSVVTLACNAGVLVGLGDFRQEKGKGSFGSFRVITADMQDDDWDELVRDHGYEAQLAAIENPQFADDDTAELMEYFYGEEKRRAA
jgi:hypothetical protein